MSGGTDDTGVCHEFVQGRSRGLSPNPPDPRVGLYRSLCKELKGLGVKEDFSPRRLGTRTPTTLRSKARESFHPGSEHLELIVGKLTGWIRPSSLRWSLVPDGRSSPAPIVDPVSTGYRVSLKSPPDSPPSSVRPTPILDDTGTPVRPFRLVECTSGLRSFRPGRPHFFDSGPLGPMREFLELNPHRSVEVLRTETSKGTERLKEFKRIYYM